MRDALLAEGSFRCFDLMMLESYRMIKDKDFSVQNRRLENTSSRLANTAESQVYQIRYNRH